MVYWIVIFLHYGSCKWELFNYFGWPATLYVYVFLIISCLIVIKVILQFK